MKMFRRIDGFFGDNKKKSASAIGALVFAVLWAILWKAFPMEFYSIFFADMIGSNIQLLLLNIVITLPLFLLFSKLAKSELSFSKTVLMNIILLVAADYVFSICLFGGLFYICVMAFIIHAAANIWTFGETGAISGNKKQPVIPVVWAAAYAFLSEALSFSLLYIIAHIYAY